jgi:hypothetical protein
MALYSEYFYSNEHKVLKFLRVPQTYLKYLFSSNLLSQRLQDLFENMDVDYFKGLLGLGELKVYKVYQAIAENKLAVNQVFEISPGPLQSFSEKLGKLIDIPFPSSHIGAKPVVCRLLSSKRRKGMVSYECDGDALELISGFKRYKHKHVAMQLNHRSR